jgi:hypothetical protein
VRGDNTGWILGWIGLAIAVVILNDYPATSPLVRYSLLLIIAYVALTNADRFVDPVNRSIDALRPPATTGKGGHGTRRLL